MTVIQVSEICIKKGESISVPDALNEAEMAFAVDTGDVMIGAPNLNSLLWRRQGKTYSQYPYGNLRLLTELDYAKLISGDVALNTPLQNFNLPSTEGKSVDIGTTTSNTVPVSATNPMPMFYLPPAANTCKMDLSIVDPTDGSISILSLLISGWGTSSSNAKCNIVVNPESNLPEGLTFYATLQFTSESNENESYVYNSNAEPVVPEEPSQNVNGTETVQQIVLGYMNTSANTYTVYATTVCWNSSADGSAPIPGLSGITAQSNVYANANVINPAGAKGPKGDDGKSYPNDGTTPVNASTITGTTATLTNLIVTGSVSIPGLQTETAQSIGTNTNISGLVLPSTIFTTSKSAAFDFTTTTLFNNGLDGYYVPDTGFTFDSPISVTGTSAINLGANTTFTTASTKGIRWAASTTDSSSYYQLAYDSTVNGLNLTEPTGGTFYTEGAVHFAGQTTLDDLIVTDLNATYIALESATADIVTTVVNGVTEITTTVAGTGTIIGWELYTADYFTYFINMRPSASNGGFRFLSNSGSNTIGENDYIVEIDDSGNIETKGGMLLGEGSTLTFSNKAGTGTIIFGYDEKQEALAVTPTGVVTGEIIFPDKVTAKSFSITGTLPVTDYSGNVPSTEWVKNYVESTKVDFTNDGTSDVYADNGAFSTIQVSGLTTLQNATAVTPVINDNSNNVATTSFVQENIQNYLSNVSLLGYVTATDVANSYVSGKYGMATTDYRVASIFYSNENNTPVLIYKDSTNTDNIVNLIDSTYATNNLATLAYVNTLFPNNNTGSGTFGTLNVAKKLIVSGTSVLGTATATTPSLSDVSTSVPTCAWVAGQNYVSGSYGVPSGIQFYNGQGLYFDITKATPVFVYSDSSGTQQNVPIITKSYADTNYVSSTTLSNTLSGYIKSSSMSSYVTASDLANYATTTDLAGYLKITDANATFARSTDLDVYLTSANAAATYVTTTDFNNTISSYATVSSLSSYLTTNTAATTYATIAYVQQQQQSSNYVQKSDLAPYALKADVASMTNVESYLTTNGYITSSSLTPYLTSTNASSTYVSKTDFNSTIQNYYTQTQSDSRYIIGQTQSTTLDTVTSIQYDPTNKYFTITYEDAKSVQNSLNVPDKTYVDNNFVKKSTIIPTTYVPWSATILFGSLSATITINDSGFYIVGCICFVWLDATITNLGTGTGNMSISNLPTNANGTYSFPLNVSISKVYSTTLSAYVSNNSISIMGTNGTTTTNLTNSNVTVGANIKLSGSYPISLT